MKPGGGVAPGSGSVWAFSAALRAQERPFPAPALRRAGGLPPGFGSWVAWSSVGNPTIINIMLEARSKEWKDPNNVRKSA